MQTFSLIVLLGCFILNTLCGLYNAAHKGVDNFIAHIMVICVVIGLYYFAGIIELFGNGLFR